LTDPIKQWQASLTTPTSLGLYSHRNCDGKIGGRRETEEVGYRRGRGRREGERREEEER
jgi:hypothetical protein